jgi:cell division protein FtsQ
VAKNDLFSSRTAALEGDEGSEQLYRPAAPSKPRASRPRQVDPQWTDTRFDSQPSKSNQEEPADDSFLRVRRRVPVRRGILPRTRNGKVIFIAVAVASIGIVAALAVLVHNFLRDDPRFRINSASYIQSLGNSQVTRPELLSVFGSDIGRNVFFVPLTERRAQLEELPWVKGATVMRLLPNQLRVSVVERVPVAFVRNGNTIGLVDGDGVLLNMTPAKMAVEHYSFPVVTGIRPSDPLPIRAARMRLYQQFVADLNSGGAKVSEQLSEVDMSDPEDIRAVMPAQGSDILVHFGDTAFLQRYKRYEDHLAEWRRLYPNLNSVDMRYDNQAVLEMSDGPSVTSGDKRQDPAPSTAPVSAPKTAVAKPHAILKKKSVVHPATKRAEKHAGHKPSKPSPSVRHKQAANNRGEFDRDFGRSAG